MTNTIDDIQGRKRYFDESLEETQGVPIDGQIDPTGDYPKRDYFFGSSVNKAAVGAKINNLSLGGSELGIDLGLPEQKSSQYPFNQVQETESGHTIEVDDTPGGERILIRHRTGAGMELRADGSVLISSQKQTVQVTGGDATVIVEGEGNLIYKGDVNLRVAGDFNVDVDGNYNLEIAGDKIENIKGRHTKTVNRDQNYTIRGSRGAYVVGPNAESMLDTHNVIVAGNSNFRSQGKMEITAGSNLITTAVGEWVAASGTANITARHISMIGHKGTIGGPLIDYYGKTYGGLPGGVTNLATFYGCLVGKASEAWHTDYAIYAANAGYSKGAGAALTAVKGGGTTPGPTPEGVEPKPGIMPFVPVAPTAPLPNPGIIEMSLATSAYGIRNVQTDPKLKEKIMKSDEYAELFNFDPDIHEIRSKLRSPTNLNNDEFTGYLVSEGLLNKDFAKTMPKNIGRSASKKGTIRFGVELLGNNPVDNRSKRFQVNEKGIFGGFFD